MEYLLKKDPWGDLRSGDVRRFNAIWWRPVQMAIYLAILLSTVVIYSIYGLQSLNLEALILAAVFLLLSCVATICLPAKKHIRLGRCEAEFLQAGHWIPTYKSNYLWETEVVMIQATHVNEEAQSERTFLALANGEIRIFSRGERTNIAQPDDFLEKYRHECLIPEVLPYEPSDALWKVIEILRTVNRKQKFSVILENLDVSQESLFSLLEEAKKQGFVTFRSLELDAFIYITECADVAYLAKQSEERDLVEREEMRAIHNNSGNVIYNNGSGGTVIAGNKNTISLESQRLDVAVLELFEAIKSHCSSVDLEEPDSDMAELAVAKIASYLDEKSSEEEVRPAIRLLMNKFDEVLVGVVSSAAWQYLSTWIA